MRLNPFSSRSNSGSTLVTVLVIGGVSSITIASMLALSGTSLRNAHGRADWNAAFFHAENALQWAAQGIADASPVSVSNCCATADSSLSLAYMATALADTSSGFKNAWVKVVRTNSSFPDTYLVTASAKVSDKVRTIQAVVRKNPASQVFDYEYFLNNWGWWWGNTITGNGGNRANWDFDFRYNPVVNGIILANGNVTENGVPVNPVAGSPPFSGLAGSDPVGMVHSGVPRIPMPNLKDFTYYQNKALANTAINGLWVGGTQVVFGVHTNSSKPGLNLVGTHSNPIVISNTVVIPGDVIIQGEITGQGTLYVGGNLYVADDLTYKNGPNWSSAPETMSTTNRDQWVSDSNSKDLVAFAVRGSILGGDVTSPEWKSYCFDPAGYGLAHVGDESHLGADGIAGTPDDNVPYLHSDGTTSTSYDADGNGVINAAYNYNTDITMTDSRAALIQGYPLTGGGQPKSYNTLASNNMNKLDAIFYTNHAAAMRLANNDAVFHGVIVSRDEAIIFNHTCVFDYDSRVHSRYNKDPNRYVDLGLPVASPLSLSNFTEVAPDSSNL
jgi:Tfp pilus assembly protein PilX